MGCRVSLAAFVGRDQYEKKKRHSNEHSRRDRHQVQGNFVLVKHQVELEKRCLEVNFELLQLLRYVLRQGSLKGLRSTYN